MSDLFEEAMDNTKKENVQMKSGEITGDQHLFHSLPKEFQAWHAVQYMLEKEGELDINSVPKSQLNANLWKTLFNATTYAIASFLLILHVILVERIIHNSFVTFIDIVSFFGISIYIAYQFYFYGIIRAQIIGPITENIYNNTSKAFYHTYSMTLGALLIMFVFILSFNESLLKLLFKLIVVTQLKYQNLDMPYLTELLFTYAIKIHNFIVVLVYQSKGYLDNIYAMTFGLTITLGALIYFIERLGYRSTREEIIYEISKDKLNKKYPIEKSQQVITAWRKSHGM